MTNPHPLTIAERFACTLGDILRAVAALGGRDHSAIPMVWLAWTRLNGLRKRFASLVARYEAGTLRAPRHRAPRQRAHGARVAAEVAPPVKPRMPGRRGWMLGFFPEAAQWGGQLQHMLGDPDMLALLAAAPQTGRIMRPLCKLYLIPVPEAWRAPPRRGRTAKSKQDKAGRGKIAVRTKPRPARSDRPSALAGPNPGVVPLRRLSGRKPRWPGAG